MSVLTAVTAQNTIGVQGVFELPAKFVAQQIDSVMQDIGADVWKIGMLGNAEIIHVVADRARQYHVKQLVLDPVMVAKSGDSLLKTEAQEALVKELVPIAYLITPNMHEAQILTNRTITNIAEMREVAIAISNMGARYVIIKGGHLPTTMQAVDVLYDGLATTEFSAPWVNTPNTHGTGCTFASAIAAELAKGSAIVDAVRIAKEYLSATLRAAVEFGIGHGHGPLNHFLGHQIDDLFHDAQLEGNR